MLFFFFKVKIVFAPFPLLGVLLCVEQSVIEVCSEEPQGSFSTSNGPESDLRFVKKPQVKPLPRPVRLDPVSVETTPNSLCSLSGLSFVQVCGFSMMAFFCKFLQTKSVLSSGERKSCLF